MLKKTFKKTTSCIKYLLFQVVIPNMIWIALLNIPIIAGFIYSTKTVAKLYLSNAELPLHVKCIAVVSTIIIGTFLIFNILYWIFRFVHRKKSPKFPSLNCDYKILCAEYELFFESREKIIQRQKMSIVVLKDKLRIIEHNLTWTGEKYIESSLKEGSEVGISLVDADKSRTVSPYRLKIVFPRDAEYNQKETYSFETFLKDDAHTMLPFFGKVIKCQTDKLIMRITVPDNLITDVYSFVSTDYQRDIPLGKKELILPKKVGNNLVYEQILNGLDLLRCYGLEWNWKQ